jgi:hypothetical protein
MTEKNNSVQQATPKKETLTDTSADAERPRHRVVRHYVGAQTDYNNVACNERNAIQPGV